MSDIVERFLVSRKTVYNAINSGRLKYQLDTINNRQVRVFTESDVLNAFPRGGAVTTTMEEVQALKEEVAALKFALAELQKAMESMDPAGQYEMTRIRQTQK
ncbi:DNA-binding protein [Erwiniaceae bacterium CAU 1747]